MTDDEMDTDFDPERDSYLKDLTKASRLSKNALMLFACYRGRLLPPATDHGGIADHLNIDIWAVAKAATELKNAGINLH